MRYVQPILAVCCLLLLLLLTMRVVMLVLFVVFLCVTYSSAKRNPSLFCWVTNFSSNLVPLRYRKANFGIDKHLQMIKFVSQKLPCL
jgi:hypothetical protein